MTSNTLTVLSVLAMLGTGGLLLLGLAFTGWGLLLGHRLLIRRSLQATALVAGLYGATLAGVSLVSPVRVLPPGAEKYFCELDCHLAYRIAGAEAVRSAEGGNTTWAVKLQTRFDERTISPRRSREAPLWPNPRRLALVGSDGRWYTDSPELTLALGEPSTPITQALRPGESYTTVLTYVLPPGVRPSGLEICEDIFVNRLMIGHERSLLHRPVLLAVVAG
ncbi:MAG TPA: hypothetical protein VG692_19930 [Gemmatimonadales bacterium]|nr:hypothetical protein [Gemmatimonadales bacterium]